MKCHCCGGSGGIRCEPRIARNGQALMEGPSHRDCTVCKGAGWIPDDALRVMRARKRSVDMTRVRLRNRGQKARAA